MAATTTVNDREPKRQEGLSARFRCAGDRHVECFRRDMSKICPRCQSRVVRRSKRRSFEHVLSWFAVFPFRCGECDRRFLARHTPVVRERSERDEASSQP
jgi:hypothetical protein